MTGRTYRVELDFRDEREAVRDEPETGQDERGTATAIDVPADETVLSAAERADEPLPFGCRTGACATCTGKLLDGELEHARPPRALKDRHLDAGYVLLCVAEPRSDCRIEVGASVANDLVSNPWK